MTPPRTFPKINPFSYHDPSLSISCAKANQNRQSPWQLVQTFGNVYHCLSSLSYFPSRKPFQIYLRLFTLLPASPLLDPATLQIWDFIFKICTLCLQCNEAFHWKGSLRHFVKASLGMPHRTNFAVFLTLFKRVGGTGGSNPCSQILL